MMGASLINYPLKTIFSTTHPYRAMIEMLLNYSKNTLKSFCFTKTNVNL